RYFSQYPYSDIHTRELLPRVTELQHVTTFPIPSTTSSLPSRFNTLSRKTTILIHDILIVRHKFIRASGREFTLQSIYIVIIGSDKGYSIIHLNSHHPILDLHY